MVGLATGLLFIVAWLETLAMVSGQVYLSLGTVNPNITTNNTEVLITDIEDGLPNEGATTLTCHTDLVACCRGMDHTGQGGLGKWLYPDGTEIPNNGGGQDFYILRNAAQLIRLNRRIPPGATSPVGLYCCVIPTTIGEMRFCANLVTSLTPVATTVSTTMATTTMETTTTTPVVMCPSLTAPTNGLMITYVPNSPTSEGTVATYQCDSGYTLNPEGTRTCQNNGSWSGGDPTCEAVMCPILSPSSNAMITFSPSGTPTSYNTIATYSCESGFRLTSDDTRTCLNNSTWSGVEPSCESPPTVIDAQPSDQLNIMIDENATFSVAATGVSLTYQWQKDGTNITDTADTYNGTTTATLTVLSVELSDAGNYTCVVTGAGGSVNSNTAQLTVATTETPTTPATTETPTTPATTETPTTPATTETPTTPAVVMCPSLTAPTNGLMITYVPVSPTSVGTVATYQCDSGYTLNPEGTRTCQNDSKWSGGEPMCEAVDCMALPNPNNGQVMTPLGTTFTNVATYSCNPGYALSGSATQTCDANGLWTPEAPTCIVPPITAEVVLPGDPAAGLSYTLMCNVTGADSLNPTINYQWFKTTPSRTQVGTNSPTLTFDPLDLSDAGQYECIANVSSPFLVGPLTDTSDKVDFNIQIPPPSVTIPAPATIFVGDSFTLTCMVQLDTSVDVGVSVAVVWTGPSGAQFATSGTNEDLNAQDTSHTSTLTVDSAMVTDSGDYTCSVTLDSSSNFITTSKSVPEVEPVVVVPAPSAPVVMAVPQTNSIQFSWTQEGGDVVESYSLSLVYIGPCSLTVEPISGSLGGDSRDFTAGNLLGFSEYELTIVATNSAGMSSAVLRTTTLPSAPSGPVQNLMVSSSNSSSVSLQWDRVNCMDRNSEITGYTVTFGPTTETVTGTDNRVFTATGLIPRTEYTFQVTPVSDSGMGTATMTSHTTLISPDITFYLGGQLFSNHGLVDPADIGEDNSALLCLTNYVSCCDSSNELFGEWFYPNTSAVPIRGFGAASLYRNRGPSLVRLNRRSPVASMDAGIYRCQILAGAGQNENVYVGLYPPGQGSPTINTDIVFDRANLSLTCTSTGGPASVVVWTRNGQPVGSPYTQSQAVTNTMDTYENVLRATDISDLVGEFSCNVTNVRGSASRSIALNGISIEGDDSLPFTVGTAASIRCVSESPATMIQWLDPSGVEVAMTTAGQTLDLPFNPVSDSLHNSVYTCRATRAEGDGGTGEQTVTLTVTVPPNSTSVATTVPAPPLAGTQYTLRCAVSKTINGLTNTPTAAWEFAGGTEIMTGGNIVVTTPSDGVAELTFTSITTSQAGTYICRGTLTSPALIDDHEVTESVGIDVLVPMPTVSLTPPTSPLYAGTSLTLTCTITVNPAVDTTVSVAVTWERTRNTGPVTITTGVSTMGSRPTFSSTVTGITLSTLDTGFTCRAVASTTQSNSPEGMSSRTVTVMAPPPPDVSIEVTGSPVAGSPYTLLCIATAPIPLVRPPTLTWMSVDTSDTGISLTPNMVLGSESRLTLTFSPLRTSHGDVYTCQAGFDIPEANLLALNASMATTVNVEIPSPTDTTIIRRPQVETYTVGLNLDLVCRVVFITAADSPLILNSQWTRNGTPVMGDGGQIVVRDFQRVGSDLPQEYESVVEFTPLNTAENNTDYTCGVTVAAQDSTYITGTTATVSTDLTVEDAPFQVVNLPTDVTAPAGSSYTLTCVISRGTSVETATLAVEWFGPDGSRIDGGQSGITVTGQSSTPDSMLISSLVFTNLMTSQGGQYTCSVNLTIAGTEVIDYNVNRTASVRVQIASPLVNVVPSRPSPHYEGTTLNLTCTIQLNLTGVNTAVMLERDFSGATNILTNPMEGTINVSMTLNPLDDKNGGMYLCSATVNSTSAVLNSQFIVTEPAQYTYTLTVDALPFPNVTITPSSLMITSGQSSTLTCTVAVVEYLFVTPSVQWMDSNGQEVDGVNNTIGTVTTSELTFTELVTSQAGPYTCRGRINVPSVVDRDSSDQVDVTARIPPPEVSITSSDQTAYHGTSHTLTCTIIIDPSVNTPVNVPVVWSIGETPIMDSDSYSITQPTLVSSSTYTANLTFTPLDLPAVSRGVYTCNVTVQPVNTTYIRQAIDSNDLTLEVLAAPPPVVTTDVPNRDGPCGGVTTFSCSGSVVDNFVVSPEVTWQDPSNQAVGNQGVLSVQNGGSRIGAGMYTCMACVDVPSVGISNLCRTTTIQISFTTPGLVLGLTCPSLGSTDTLNITWSPPTDGGDVIVGYQVEVTMYVPGEGRQVTTVNLTEPFNKEITPSSAVVTGLASTIRYLISVMGVSASGCGSKVTVECYTEEGVPQMIQDVKVVRLSDSEMNVSWVPLTIVEARGFLENYSITYSRGGGARRKRQTKMVVVSPDQSSVVIDGLEAGVDYGVTVAARNLNTGTTSSPSTTVRSGLPPSTSNVGVIVAIIIVVIVLVIVVVVAIIVIVYLVQKHKQKGKFKVSTQRAYELSDRNSSPIEPTAARPHSPFDDDFDQLENEKSKEAAAEADEVAPVATSAEVLDRMKPISLSSFRGHVQNMHDDRAKGFEAEYQSFSLDPLEPHDIAKVSYNRIKNRFANIFPFDHSRVTLKPVAGVEGSDYINACFINGYQRENCYIAAQGPMPNSMEDFWRMIWEYKLANVVMLTKCKEGGRVKCEQYWAEDIGSVFETENKSMAVTTLSVVPFADFVIRQFTLKNNNEPDSETLKVTQFHFTAWPDHGVPKFATSLIAFIRKTQRGHLKDKGVPLLVHCSAGVGRTGTFITLDSMLERIHKETSVNVYEFVKLMRTRRVLMVQTLAQYTFIHDALGELITCGETDIPAGVLRTKVNLLSKVIPGKGITGFANQFQLLDQVSRVPEPEDVTDAVEHYNLDKNRYPDKIPYNMSRARLRPTGEDGSEYINASFVDGYKQRNAYIATQGPMKNTVNDLWRMIWEFKSKTLVMVCNMEEEGSESAFIYWPFKEGEMIKYGKINVTLQSKAAYGEFTVRKFMVHEERPAPAKQLDGFVVTQFHHTEWPSHGRPQTGTLIEMLDMITKSQMSTGNRPITVMCNDGVGRSGTFICIHAQLERLKTEGVVDFFQSIKSARIQRAGLVPDVAQYTFCHEVLADYIDKFDNYANFKDML